MASFLQIDILDYYFTYLHRGRLYTLALAVANLIISHWPVPASNSLLVKI